MVAQHPSDSDLLERAQAGDKDALDALLARYQGRVYRFGMKMCRDPEDAKDVLQDTLLSMARGVRDFRGASSLSTWLYTIARSFCIKHRRKSKFAPETECSLDDAAATDIADSGPNPEEHAVGAQVESALEAAVHALEPKYREVFVLRDIEGLTASEVADVLKISVSGVKSRLHRARLTVRSAIAPALGLKERQPHSPEECPDILQTFSSHLEGDISASVCAEMEAHVGRCDRCRDACDSLKRTLALCTASPTPEVPKHIQQSVRDHLRRAG